MLTYENDLSSASMFSENFNWLVGWLIDLSGIILVELPFTAAVI